MKANQRVPAPRGRRTHSFGSTWRRREGNCYCECFYNQTIAFPDAELENAGCDCIRGPSYTWSHVLPRRNNSAIIPRMRI
jgi:hypothetical protein